MLLGLVLESTAEGMMLEVPQGTVLVRYEALVEIGVVPDSELQQQGSVRIGIAPVAAPLGTDEDLRAQLDALLAEAVALIPSTTVLSSESWLEDLGPEASALQACQGDLRCARRYAAGRDLVYVLVPTVTGLDSAGPRLGLTAVVASTGTTISAGATPLILREQDPARVDPANSGQGVLEAAFAALAIQPTIDLSEQIARAFPRPKVLGAVVASEPVAEQAPTPTEVETKDTVEDEQGAAADSNEGQEAEQQAQEPAAESEDGQEAVADAAVSPDESDEAQQGEQSEDEEAAQAAATQSTASASDDDVPAEEPVAVATQPLAAADDESSPGESSAEGAVEAETAASSDEPADAAKSADADPSMPSTEPSEATAGEDATVRNNDAEGTHEEGAQAMEAGAQGSSTESAAVAHSDGVDGAEETEVADEAGEGETTAVASSAEPEAAPVDALQTRLIASPRGTRVPLSRKKSIAMGFLPVPGLPSALAGDIPGFVVAVAGTVGASWATIYLVGRVAPTAGAFWAPSIITPYAINVAFNQVCGAVSLKVKAKASTGPSAQNDDANTPAATSVTEPLITTAPGPLVGPGGDGRLQISGAGIFLTGSF